MMEDQAQEPLNLNLILSGLIDDNSLKDQCITVAAEQLQLDPYKLDIIDVKKLPPSRRRVEPPKYRIRFGDIISRTSFYKARTGKGCKIWMNEDLCPARSKLAFQARKVVLDKQALRTWTYLGKVFTLENVNSTPKLINRFEELPPLKNIEQNAIPN